MADSSSVVLVTSSAPGSPQDLAGEPEHPVEHRWDQHDVPQERTAPRDEMDRVARAATIPMAR